MTVLELCEPLFQYVCRINRSARKGGVHNLAVVRDEIRGIFNEMFQKSLGTPGLRDQYEKVRLPLVYFVDYMIRGSKLNATGTWKALAEEEEPPIYTGDESFFDPELNQTMAERGESADERLAVFYTCMGLGFMGYLEGQPQKVREKMREIAARIKGMMDPENAPRICEDAYNADTRDLTLPPLKPLMPIVVALVGLIIVLLASNAYLYHTGSKELSQHLKKVIDRLSPQQQQQQQVQGAQPQR